MITITLALAAAALGDQRADRRPAAPTTTVTTITAGTPRGRDRRRERPEDQAYPITVIVDLGGARETRGTTDGPAAHPPQDGSEADPETSR